MLKVFFFFAARSIKAVVDVKKNYFIRITTYFSCLFSFTGGFIELIVTRGYELASETFCIGYSF